MSLTFYYSPRSNASRIFWTLAELGVPHEAVKLDLRAGDQKKPEFLAKNPNGKVPTIVLDGTPMFESVAIQIALGERYGVEKGLWPKIGSAEHFQALSWLVWGQVSVGTALIRYLMNTGEWMPKEQQNAGQAESALKEIHSLLKILNDRLDGRDYVVGSSFTIADLDLASVMAWGVGFAKIDISAYPKLQAWLGKINERPAAKAADAAEAAAAA
jgi:glutathione S-transferase